MIPCDHERGALCGICHASINSCCGDATECDDCEQEFCNPCVKKYEIDEDFCPVCNRLIVTDDQILCYLLGQVFMNRKQVVELLQNQPIEGSWDDDERCFKCDKRKGILINCNSCPRVFHPDCSDFETGQPPDGWQCKRCTSVKSVGVRDKSPVRK
jgi:hypothetical protein